MFSLFFFNQKTDGRRFAIRRAVLESDKSASNDLLGKKNFYLLMSHSAFARIMSKSW